MMLPGARREARGAEDANSSLRACQGPAESDIQGVAGGVGKSEA